MNWLASLADGGHIVFQKCGLSISWAEDLLVLFMEGGGGSSSCHFTRVPFEGSHPDAPIPLTRVLARFHGKQLYCGCCFPVACGF